MPKLAGPFVSAMAKYQALGRDIEALRDFLAARQEGADPGVRVLACVLTTSELMQELIRIQIAGMRDS